MDRADLILDTARRAGRTFKDDEFEGIAALACVEKWDTFDTATDESAWSWTIARNAALDELKRAWHRYPKAGLEEDHALLPGQTMAEGCELRLDIARFLEISGPKVRDAVARRLMGCPKEGDRKLIERARKRFGWVVE